MDLVRELLLRLEALPLGLGDVVVLSGRSQELRMEGRPPDEVDYHLALIQEAALIDVPDGTTLYEGIIFQRLSWSGHDFLDSVRDPETWAKTKKAAAGAGGFTMDLLRDLAKGFIKKQVEEHTGVKL